MAKTNTADTLAQARAELAAAADGLITDRVACVARAAALLLDLIERGAK